MSNVLNYLSKNSCCGCSACVETCPVDAIGFIADKKGFLYPHIENGKCVECRKCIDVCPVLVPQIPHKPYRILGVKNNDYAIKKHSSSGGLFSLIAVNIMKCGGIIYGATFNDKWNVQHIKCEELSDLEKLYGSKYVQSNLRGIFSDIKSNLKKGIKVLFSGAPCQVSALYRYLSNMDISNLTTVDFVCHGVPNPKIWSDYIKEFQQEKKCIINNISFRDKRNGWIDYGIKIDYSNPDQSRNTYYAKARQDPYMLAFLNDYILRPSCHCCSFRQGSSGSDFTMADFWGIDKTHQEFYDHDGVSMLMINNPYSDTSFLKYAHTLQTSYEDAVVYNPAIVRDWDRNNFSALFYILHNFFHCNVKRTVIICEWLSKSFSLLGNLFRVLKQKIFSSFKKIIKKTIYGNK